MHIFDSKRILATAIPFLLLSAHPQPAAAGVELKVSVKFIRSSDGSVGPGDVTTVGKFLGVHPCDELVTFQDFADRIDYANKVLDRTGRGYRFVVEYLTITPPPVSPGQTWTDPNGNLITCGDRGTPGRPNDCANFSPCSPEPASTIVINEFMANPNAVVGNDGEWVELHNPTGSPIDLAGWSLGNADNPQFTIGQQLVVPAEGYVVLGRRDDFYANGNVPVDVAYGTTFRLNNGSDSIVLRDPGGVVRDEVTYDADMGWPIVSGASACLRSTGVDNDCADAWIASQSSYWTEWVSIGDLPNCRPALHEEAYADWVSSEASGVEGNWAWDPQALNVYIIAGCTGGASGTTRYNHVTAVIGQNEAGGFLRPFHELGHSLGICHTHDCFDWNPLPCFCSEGTSNEDCLADTPVDSEAWNNQEPAGMLAETVAQNEFSMAYDLLTDDQKQAVLDVVYNVMSYHRDDDWGFPHLIAPDDEVYSAPLSCGVDDIDDIPSSVLAADLPDHCRHRLSADQMDRITDFANTLFRREHYDPSVLSGAFASGLTHFVDQDMDTCPPCSSSDSMWECWPGSSLTPHPTISDALDAVTAEDMPGMDHVVMFRPGSYDEQPTILNRVELRSTGGPAVLGE